MPNSIETNHSDHDPPISSVNVGPNLLRLRNAVDVIVEIETWSVEAEGALSEEDRERFSHALSVARATVAQYSNPKATKPASLAPFLGEPADDSLTEQELEYRKEYGEPYASVYAPKEVEFDPAQLLMVDTYLHMSRDEGAEVVFHRKGPAR